MPKLLLAPLSAWALTACSAPAVFERPCPMVTEIPAATQAAAAVELETKDVPALAAIMTAVAPDRAFNRAVCP